MMRFIDVPCLPPPHANPVLLFLHCLPPPFHQLTFDLSRLELCAVPSREEALPQSRPHRHWRTTLPPPLLLLDTG